MADKKIKNKLPSKKWSKYKLNNDKLERKPTCPRCGAGNFMAEHKDRLYCGKCAYTVFNDKRISEGKKAKVSEEQIKAIEKEIAVEESESEES